ncbi:MAG: phosphoribosylpyrophosphate synthetase, partial [Rhodospirillales bacterium CG15_BIG_FIL_POST_REV_8_21_14_020_66_15]
MTAAQVTLQGFPEGAAQARRLADALAVPYADIAVHRFPDGESLVRVGDAAETAVLYRSLDDPNVKLVELMLAASALRDAGATRLVLVAPYLCYMRQDAAFHAGEAVSQKAVGHFLDGLFDGIVTVDPHLHRTRSLAAVMSSARTATVSAAPLLARRLRDRGLPADAVVLGPDEESRQWVDAVAAPLGLDILVGQKLRTGDRDVAVDIPGIEQAAERPVVMVDDVVSTGATLAECARLLRGAGAASVDVTAVHMLCPPPALAGLRAAGVGTIESTDSVPHGTNT